MGSLFLNQMKKQACSFLQEKYKTARLALTDITPIELLTEEATNNEPWGPDAKTMTQIAVASFGVDAYWRIIDILHKRLDTVDWKQWRQSYKTLVLLEFLMTHGPEELAYEFQNDIDIIEELGTFQFIDDKGFDWGANMHKRSESILSLLRGGGTALRAARLKALKISKEIQGFGSSTPSSAAASSSPTSPAATATPSSAVSNSSFASAGSTFEDICRIENLALAEDLDQLNDPAAAESPTLHNDHDNNNNSDDTNHNDHQPVKTLRLRTHRWECGYPVQEKGSLLDVGDDEVEDRKPSDQQGLVGRFCDKMMTTSPKKNKDYGEKNGYHNNGNDFRSFSDVGKFLKKRYERQFSMGY
ncbi:unnamed protein product [Linum trigynum]|uniref:ENTH domain-containing protein n=1 Tax=Linum trigynum TaxID=586398 RepID=A0AAV2FDH1_9ROSI